MQGTEGLVATIADLITTLGAEWVLWLLLGLSVVSFAIMLERWWYFVRRRVDLDTLADRLARAIGAGDMEQAATLTQGGRSLEARVVQDGLTAVEQQLSARALQEMVERAVARERRGYERALWFLGTLGNNAPFIGLFGTVLGIIKAFSDLAGDVRGGASVVMGGISEALVATAVGLLVALPAVIAYNLFQRKLRAVINNAEVLTRTMLVYAHGQELPGQAGHGPADPSGGPAGAARLAGEPPVSSAESPQGSQPGEASQSKLGQPAAAGVTA